ncbi:TetR/AcrR family transcriptional regulator [Cryptosporangium minutisporangium]|uniref:TetR/AcrR family transcriptional regulator n=2 Tax=Cryptosporangium minutisporangium TaxID=113569 RepID=A0ABP6SQ53_9ACTN
MVARLLASAGELFLERGYDRTTTNHVAEHAGVSVGSLYQFFPDKAALLTALQAEWGRKLHTALDAALTGEAEQLPLEQLIDRVLAVHVMLNQNPPGLLGFLYTTPGAADQQHSPTAITLHERIARLVEARGVPMSAARRAVVTQLLGHIVSALYYVGGANGPTNGTLVRETKQALLAYLRTIEAPPRSRTGFEPVA